MKIVSKKTIAPRVMTATVFLAVALGLMLLSPASAQPAETFADRLAKNRYQIDVKDGRLSGTGAAVLESALTGAQFVLVGEDHGMVQVPQFNAAVCALLGPAGFYNLAIETGPTAAGELEKWAAASDGRQQLATFEKEYPESIAFYNWSEEYDMLTRCARSATGGKFHVWGLDQELMGASRILLTRIIEQHPGPEATKEAQRLLQKNDDARATAAKSGNPGELFMLTASDDELAGFKDLLAREGNATSQDLLAALIESRQIYQNNMSGNGFDSNRQRALLMKTTFIHEYAKASEAEGKPPKVMFKFGGEHMFKGFNPLHNNDLGNFVAELADYNHSKSVHVLILGMKGKQLRFAGIGQPMQAAEFNLAEDKDSDFLYLKPMFEKVGSDGLTMFDLRAFRKHFASLGAVDKEMERLIFGYDFLVVFPNAAPSKSIP